MGIGIKCGQTKILRENSQVNIDKAKQNIARHENNLDKAPAKVDLSGFNSKIVWQNLQGK